MSSGTPIRIFARVGPPVTARLLENALEWISSTGDILLGEAGDWIITDATGSIRTIKTPQLRANYRHISGDLWQREGQVRALRVDDDTAVDTLEGPATARAGDWIVTSEDGARWPVPDAEFRSGYVPESGTWETSDG